MFGSVSAHPSKGGIVDMSYNFTQTDKILPPLVYVGDLHDIKLAKKVHVIYDKSSCQWNKFLKDFYADEINNTYLNKLEEARRF